MEEVSINVSVENITDGYQKVPDQPTYILVYSTLMYALIFLTGIVGNILVIVVILCTRNMKTVVNYYLLNLCIADIMVMLICLPLSLVLIYTKDAWIFGEAMCHLVPFLENVVATASVLTIVSISIERYRVVSKPLNTKSFQKCHIKFTIMFIWICACVVCAPFLFIANYKDSKFVDGTPIKVCRTYISHPWQKTYIVLQNLIFFVLPFIVLVILYIMISCLLVPLEDALTDTNRMAYRDKQRLKRQVINILTTIALVFFLCYVPFRIVALWITFTDTSNILNLGLEGYLNLMCLVRLAFYLNHALNPILYSFLSVKFRTSLRILCTHGCKQHKSYHGSNTGVDPRAQNGFIKYGRFSSPVIQFRLTKRKNRCSTCYDDEKESSHSSSRQFMNDFSMLYAKTNTKHSKCTREENKLFADVCNDIKKSTDNGEQSADGVYVKIKPDKMYLVIKVKHSRVKQELATEVEEDQQ